MHPDEILLVTRGSATGTILPARGLFDLQREAAQQSTAHVDALAEQLNRQLAVFRAAAASV